MLRKQKNKSLYERDFCLWSFTQADLIRKGKLANADMEHIAEEIESLGSSDRRSLYSHLVRYFQHMLNIHHTPENQGNSNSWHKTVSNAKFRIKKLIKDSPSLKKELMLKMPIKMLSF